MGMREDREADAASAIARCERLFLDSPNPYYVVSALAAARQGGFAPPDWALRELLGAVETAVHNYHRRGDRISLDAALGFKLTRGKTPREREAARHGAEIDAFDLARTIHACFELSIPEACEVAFNVVNFSYARACEENLWRPSEMNRPLPKGITREQWDDVDRQWREKSTKYIEALDAPTVAKQKMLRCQWWSITHGDLLGYSLDQFIDRFYREGTKRLSQVEQARPDLSKVSDFYEGVVLLVVPDNCASKVIVEHRDSPPRSISAVEALPKRKAFESFLRSFPAPERFGLK